MSGAECSVHMTLEQGDFKWNNSDNIDIDWDAGRLCCRIAPRLRTRACVDALDTHHTAQSTISTQKTCCVLTMAYINQKTWNLITVLFGFGYLLLHSLPFDVSQHAFLIAFYKAIPVWMCSLLAMVGNDSVVGVALVFGSCGDIMLDIRDEESFRADEAVHRHLFRLGVGLFLVQHVLIICQFAAHWRAFRAHSLLPFALSLLTLYLVVLPNVSQELRPLVCVYSLALSSSCFVSLNGLSRGKALKHEKMNVTATLLFLLSDFLVISREIIERGDANANAVLLLVESANPTIVKGMVMITYYASQMMFANGAYNRYRHRRALRKQM